MNPRHLFAYLLIALMLGAAGYGIYRWRNTPIARQRRRRAKARRAKARLQPRE